MSPDQSLDLLNSILFPLVFYLEYKKSQKAKPNYVFSRSLKIFVISLLVFTAIAIGLQIFRSDLNSLHIFVTCLRSLLLLFYAYYFMRMAYDKWLKPV